MRFDDDQVKMEFLSCEESLVPEEVLASLVKGPIRCKPRFLIYQDGEKKDEIDGADYNSLEMSIAKNIVSLDD